MDWLESLLPLLFLLIYFLAQIRKRGKASPAPVEDGMEVELQGKRTPFEEFIRQIQEAAEAAHGSQQDPQPPVIVQSSFDAPPPLSPPLPLNSPVPKFHELGGFEHDEHSFGLASPFSEEAFERLPPSPAPPAHAAGHMDYNPHAPPGGVGVVDARSRARHPLVRQLRTNSGLRDALILKEILDKPLSQRR